jgi:energy-coupling factor transporter ATP-binding protein EcfA2
VVITTVLGAPGSGKTTVVPLLAGLLPGYVVLDWDAFMVPAAALAGRDIRSSPATWPAYRQLVRSVAGQVAHLPVVLLGGSTPAELAGWPVTAWLLLDCADQERRRRLAARDRPGETETAISDARAYRSLGLPVIDTTGLAPEAVARCLADFVQGQPPGTAGHARRAGPCR